MLHAHPPTHPPTHTPTHTHIKTLSQGFFEDPQRVYLVLDLCPGGDLYHLLKTRGPFTEPQVWALALWQ